MEKVQEQEQTIEVFENDIQLYLSMFCEENGIEDMKKESQSVWNSCLMYIQRNVFCNRDLLKQSNNIYNSNSIMDSNYNMYNYDLLYDILEYYVYICNMYNKEISIMGFSKLTKIDTDTINSWGNNENKLSSKSSVIYKKLSQEREESLSNKLADGKQNPVGVIAILNRQYGWASPYTSDSNKQRKSISAEEIRQLIPKSGDYSSNCTMIESVNNATDQSKEPSSVENKG